MDVRHCVKMTGNKKQLVKLRIFYLQGLNYHKDIIIEEFKKTGKCNLQILVKEGFSTVMGSFALQKNSEYTKIVNQG